jgi:hypothetical protein
MHRKPLTVSIAYFVCGVIAFGLVILLEVSLRMIFPEIAPKPREIPNQELAYQFNSDYLVSLKPNISNIYITTEEMGSTQILWTTNSHSFRGKELEDKPDVRIIVYGDSNIQARFSRLEDTFPYRLEQYLRAYMSKDIEVLNAGIIGFGPDQVLIRFRKDVDTYKPNIVIVNISAENDFGDIIRNRLFELDNTGKLVRTVYKTEVDEAFNNVGLKGRSFKDYVLSLIIMRPAVKVIKLVSKEFEARELIDRIQSFSQDEYSVYQQREPRKFSHFADHYDFDIAIDPDSESSRVKIKLMEAVLKELKSLAFSKNIELAIVIQPSVIDLTENFKFSFKHLARYSRYKRSNLTDAVETICRASGVHFINLFNAFLENGPEELYFRGGDPHWNNQGQQIAARETASFILTKILRDDVVH